MNFREKLFSLKNKNNQVIKIKLDGDTISEQAQSFFYEVYGLPDVKENIYRALMSEMPVRMGLHAPPATAKSFMMEIIYKQCSDVVYFNAAAGSTGAGLYEELNNNRGCKILIIDEADKMRKNDIEALLGILNNDGWVRKTLKSIKYNFQLKNLKVFLTSNSLVKMSKAIMSRIQWYHLSGYSDEEFIKVVGWVLRDNTDPVTSEVMARVLIEHELKDVRHAINMRALINVGGHHDSEDKIIEIMENWINRVVNQDIDYNKESA